MKTKTRSVKSASKTAAKPVEVPADLQAALGKSTAVKKAFFALAPSHQREYLKWILEAKQDETRARRITETLRKIAAGVAQ